MRRKNLAEEKVKDWNKASPIWKGVPVQPNKSDAGYMKCLKLYLPAHKINLVHNPRWSYNWVYKAMWNTARNIIRKK